MLVAPQLSVQATDRLGTLLGRCGQHLPVVGRLVAENMRALKLYSSAAHAGYFTHLGWHFAGALQALRCAGHAQCVRQSADLAGLAASRIEFDESVSHLLETVAEGRGAVLVGPHISNYLLNLTRLNQVLPLTVYLRYSKQHPRREAKQRWYQASGVGWISEATQAGGALGRLGRMADALRAGRVLFITPDLPQKRDSGTPVRFFDREIYLPAGAAALAVRSGAPLFLLTAKDHGTRQRLVVQGPFEDQGGLRRGARREAIQRRMQWFASGLERFLRQQTALWYLWGDKRWTRVFRGDPRYVRWLPATAAPPPTETTSLSRAK